VGERAVGRARAGGAPSPLYASVTIVTPRLGLVPLRVEDADEMAGVLADERLHEFVGGRPVTAAELRERYAGLVAGSRDRRELWLNWIVRRRSDGRAIGTVQATLFRKGGETTGNVAWVVGVEWQGQGFASEAARALVEWLRKQGVGTVVAHVHPDHRASAAVARRAGLEPTDEEAGGERVWRTPRVPPAPGS
jgi:RimJ/RimL family protein N-acetyltransferase